MPRGRPRKLSKPSAVNAAKGRKRLQELHAARAQELLKLKETKTGTHPTNVQMGGQSNKKKVLIGDLNRRKHEGAKAMKPTICNAEDGDKCRVYKPPQHVTASSIVAAMRKRQKSISTVTDSSCNDDKFQVHLELQSGAEGFEDRVKDEVCTSDVEDQGDTLGDQIAPSCFICRADTGAEIGLMSLPSFEHYSFFMYELLEIPIGETKTYLEQLEKPENWIKLCESCQLLVVKGKAVRQQISELQGQLKQFKKTVLENMKRVINIDPTSVTQGESTEFLKQHGALRMIQNFVSGKTYWGLDVERETWQPTMRSKGSFSVVHKWSPGIGPTMQKSLHNVTIVKAPTISDSDQDDFSEANSPLGYADLDLDPLDITEPIQVETDVSAKCFTSTRSCPSPIPSTASSVGKINTISIDGQKRSPNQSEKKISRKKPNPNLGKSISHTKRSSLDLGLPLNQRCDYFQTLYKRTVYDCPHCPQIKNYSVMKYALHIDMHLRMPYQCSKCLELLPVDAELREQHWKEKHACSEDNLTLEAETFIKLELDPGQIWKCVNCYQGFSSDMDRTKHEIDCCDSSGDPPVRRKRSLSYSCTFCQASLRNFPEWRLHRAIHHPEMDRMCCYYCDKSFCEKTVEGFEARHDTKMLDHMISAHTKNEFGNQIKIFEECSSCGLVFHWMADHKKHFLEKHGVSEREPYRCKICNRGCSMATYLRFHMTIQHFQCEACICDICGLERKKRIQLANHKMTEHGVDPEPGDGYKIFTCPKEGCSYKSVLTGKISWHIRAHHEKTRPFSCNICGKRFSNSKRLQRHEEIHRNKQSKPYQCDICGNAFAVFNYLYIHKRLSHEGRAFPSTNKKKAPRLRMKGSGSKKAKPVNTQQNLEVGGVGEVQAHLQGLSGDLPVPDLTSQAADSI